MRAALLIASLLCLAPAPARPAAPKPDSERQTQVLVIYATRRDAQLAVVGERDLPRLFEDGLDGRLDYYTEFIDPGRFEESDYQEALGAFLQKKYEDHRFDLIVAIGDEAVDFVRRYRRVFPGAPPLVYSGASRRLRRPVNSTGIIVEPNLWDTVTLAKTLDPQLTRLFAVSGLDSGPRALEKVLREQLAGRDPGIEIVYLTGLTTTALSERLATLPPHSAVYYLSVSRDSAGEYFHPLQYIERVVAAANAPTYSWVDSTMGLGVVGGSLKSQTAQVKAVANLGLSVLRGQPADFITVTVRDFNVVQVDWRQLQHWGLSESRVPAGAIVLYREPSPWVRYRSYVVGAFVVLLAQTALIAGLLVQRRRRRRAEDSLVESEAQLSASYRRIRDLGARLLKAQDSERSFIARELHDDIGQQLALIEMDVKLLGSGHDVDTGFAGAILERVQSVARSLRELSHRLHPARLRLIGLVAALKGLQAEMSHSVPISFTHENVPASLPAELTVCLFRVAQEALNNALKYSGAVHVSVTLTGQSDSVALSILDDGAGFDVAAAWGKGIGLATMRERVEAIGGTLMIHSTPGDGTRVDVTVPISAKEAGAIAV